MLCMPTKVKYFLGVSWFQFFSYYHIMNGKIDIVNTMNVHEFWYKYKNIPTDLRYITCQLQVFFWFL